MKTDCQWFNSNLEAYFAEELPEDDARLANEHLQSCPSCSAQARELRDIDPLVKQVFRLRLAQAQTAIPIASPKRMTLALAGTGMVLALLIALVVNLRPSPQIETVAGADSPVTDPVVESKETPVDKSTALEIGRAKPEPLDASTSRVVQPAPKVAATVTDSAFAVIDDVGHEMTLENYRGKALLFGVWSSDQAGTAEGMERLYKALGGNPKLRILGVASKTNDKAKGTFPVVFNHGSQLLGLRPGQFVLLDASGNKQATGSLLEDANTSVPEIKAHMSQLGIK
jgi:hypothetical protein